MDNNLCKNSDKGYMSSGQPKSSTQLKATSKCFRINVRTFNPGFFPFFVEMALGCANQTSNFSTNKRFEKSIVCWWQLESRSL